METRKVLVAMAAAAGLYASFPSVSTAAPANGSAILDLMRENSLAQKVRVFCYNRRTGRFLHWGSCQRRTRPRVYCYNRRTGRFLHWGSCRR